MKHGSECADRLATLLKRLGRSAPAGAEAPERGPLEELVYAFLLWESNTTRADAAWAALTRDAVDFNELRVTLPHEASALIGEDYPRSLDRCQRLRAALNDVYRREHAVSLDRLKAWKKREVREYVDTIEGIVPFVAGRVLLLAFDTHAIPADEQLRALLIEEEAADPSADVADLSNWLARHIRADDAKEAHRAFQAWVDERTHRGPSGGKGSSRRTRKKSTGKKTKRKTSTRGGGGSSKAAS